MGTKQSSNLPNPDNRQNPNNQDPSVKRDAAYGDNIPNPDNQPNPDVQRDSGYDGGDPLDSLNQYPKRSSSVEDFINDTYPTPSTPPSVYESKEGDKTSGITEGRIVHYVMFNGVHRPAIIVNAWDGGIGTDKLVNLSVFTDCVNDANAVGIEKQPYDPDEKQDIQDGLIWKTSVKFDDSDTPSIGSWHWIEKA